MYFFLFSGGRAATAFSISGQVGTLISLIIVFFRLALLCLVGSSRVSAPVGIDERSESQRLFINMMILKIV